MKFLLIHPEISRTKYNFKGIIENECLELEYIAAMLKEHDMEYSIFDGQIEEERVDFRIKKYKPDVVYVCGRTRQENFMLEYCKAAKQYNPKIITIAGGQHAELCSNRLYNEYVDYILTNPDIFHILDIIGGNDVSKIDSLCYKKDGRWRSNPKVAFDIDRLPFPDRTYFYEHPDNYRYLELEHSAWVRTAFSCPYRCKFCHRNKINCSTYVTRKISDVVDEIASIRTENIYIVDDDFLFNEERIYEFIKLIKEKGISKKYICYGRTDFIAAHPQIMYELKNIGFYYILSGLESVDDKKLQDYNKKTSTDANIMSIEICNKYGLNLMGMFITDLNFTSADFRNMYKWIKKHNLKHAAVSIYTPEMNSEEELNYDLITTNPSHYDYLHLVAKPLKISVSHFYLCHYILVIKLFLKAKKEGVYDFINYGDYIKSFIRNIITGKRKNDDE